MSSLWQVIPRWFSQEAAKENVRFVGCAAGGFGCLVEAIGLEVVFEVL